ncbi:MAG TPA: ATP-binding protein [Pyrinomonadaceae bacterium]|jgi:signal transduction histidine kinase
MSLLEILQLIGYSTAAVLPFWMGAMLVRRRHSLSKIERVLLVLAFCMSGWHASNLVLNLHSMLGLDEARWTVLLRLADTLAVVTITLTYSFLLHVHLHLWANAHDRQLSRTERVRVYLSYIPALFLVVAVPRLWTGAYAPMFEKLSFLLLPFALWACYVLCLIAVTDFLISRISRRPTERRLMRTLAGAFVAIAVLVLVVYAFGLGDGTTLGLYLKTTANLGSLLPTALLAYHIYRYRYLELIIRESLIVAAFAAVVLIVYLYGIRTISARLTSYYGLRQGALESLMILTLALVAAPLRRWMDKKFHQLFEHEAALYRDVVTRIGAHGGRYRQLPELLRFVEERTTSGLGLRRVYLIVSPPDHQESDNADDGNADFHESLSHENLTALSPETHASGAQQQRPERAWDAWAESVMESIRAEDWQPLEGDEMLRERGFEIAYALRREEREVGLMLVDAAPDALTHDVRAVLEILAGQVAIAIEDCRLVEENVRLERRVAQGERLAALGQMAATVAHEVKNPLSAIKSIAQVMREDDQLGDAYARDLDLIVGETDRLNRSVTQMLSFARSLPPASAPQRAEELIRGIFELFRVEANNRGVALECHTDALDNEHSQRRTNGNNSHASDDAAVRRRTGVEPLMLDGARASALRDALSNLLLNALQATPAGGRVSIEASVVDEHLSIAVTDSGRGVPQEMSARIWEPFFTTKQRGTGLGLAIVRKRMEEVGGVATLAPTTATEHGARFELRLPLPKS